FSLKDREISNKYYKYYLSKLSDYNPPPLAPPARGGDLYRYSLPLDGGGLGWGCLIINSTSSMIILLGIAQLRWNLFG
ncbi:MAG: hypothetical protein Q8P40_04535, partial [Nitrospirota bacterium]|nr:hypothetical protein [Nitrospirota bacterium]